MLIESLLESEESATWVVGTRRLGKTSMLRQLEWMVSRPEASYRGRAFVPIFWDLQGCETPEDLAYELDLALEDKRAQLEKLEIDLDALPLENAVAVLRVLGRMADERNVRILLLIDEAEALIAVGRSNARWLGSLRKALLEGKLRTILTSTRMLSQLNHLNARWTTSPFLFGIQPVQLWALGPEMAGALVRQSQGIGVKVDDANLAQILAYANGHPYLVQYLCERLFVSQGKSAGSLRSVEERDLEVDHLLAGFFGIDFRSMTRLERRILLVLSNLTLASEGELASALSDVSGTRIRMFLSSLSRLGYVRRIKNQWAVGNEFLRRWLYESYAELSQRLDSVLDEDEEEANLRAGIKREIERLRQKIAQVEKELAELETAYHSASDAERETLIRRIRRLRRELITLRRALDRVRSGERAE